MYSMKRQICKKRKEVVRAVSVLLLLSVFFPPVLKAQTTTYTKAESFLFSFKESSDMFLADYGDNAYQLERMGQRLPVFRSCLLAGSCHLLVVSHVGAYGYEEDGVVNEASLRASRIRACLKTRLDIPSECVAFYIDRSGNYRDRVHVYLIETPLPWFANIAIHYSESRYPVAVKAAVEKYGAVPYVDLYRRGEAGGYDRVVYRIDDPLFDRSELEDYRLASVVDTPKRGNTTITTRETLRVVKKEGKPETAVTAAVREPALPQATAVSPFFMSVKTNLLPWCTVAPSIQLGTGDVKMQTPLCRTWSWNGILRVAGRWRCRVCMPILRIRTRRATAGRCRRSRSSLVSGRCAVTSLRGSMPACSVSTAISMFGAAGSIPAKSCCTAGPAVFGRWGLR